MEGREWCGEGMRMLTSKQNLQFPVHTIVPVSAKGEVPQDQGIL